MRKSAAAEVHEYQRKMEDMQLNFAQMLKETLDKVGLGFRGGGVITWTERLEIIISCKEKQSEGTQ